MRQVKHDVRVGRVPLQSLLQLIHLLQPLLIGTLLQQGRFVLLHSRFVRDASAGRRAIPYLPGFRLGAQVARPDQGELLHLLQLFCRQHAVVVLRQLLIYLPIKVGDPVIYSLEKKRCFSFRAKRI